MNTTHATAGRAGFALLGMLFCALAASAARGGVLSPNLPVDNTSQAVWGDRWWQWVISYPPNASPMTDTTGAFSHLGDQGAVFYLAGTISGPANRSVTIPQGKTIFVPLGSSISPIPLFGADEAAVRADAAATNGTPSNLALTIDGSAAVLPAGFSSLTQFHQVTPPGTFSWTVPANNIYSSFGLSGGTYQSVDDGYLVMLDGLTPGNHTLHWTGHFSGTPPTYPAFDIDMTYRVTLTPDPTAAAGLIASAAFASIHRRRDTRRSRLLR